MQGDCLYSCFFVCLSVFKWTVKHVWCFLPIVGQLGGVRGEEVVINARKSVSMCI